METESIPTVRVTTSQDLLCAKPQQMSRYFSGLISLMVVILTLITMSAWNFYNESKGNLIFSARATALLEPKGKLWDGMLRGAGAIRQKVDPQDCTM